MRVYITSEAVHHTQRAPGLLSCESPHLRFIVCAPRCFHMLFCASSWATDDRLCHWVDIPWLGVLHCPAEAWRAEGSGANHRLPRHASETVRTTGPHTHSRWASSNTRRLWLRLQAATTLVCMCSAGARRHNVHQGCVLVGFLFVCSRLRSREEEGKRKRRPSRRYCGRLNDG